MICRLAVWCIDLVRTQPVLTSWERHHNVLTAPEAAFPEPARRTTRTALRFGLWMFAGEAVARQALTTMDQGRPRLSGAEAPVFSVSHSRDRAVIAIADRDPLGVDIETPRSISLSQERRHQITGYARAVGLDVPDLESSGDVADDAFLRVWTQLEAIGKARGDGVMATLGALHDAADAPVDQPLAGLITEPCRLATLDIGAGIHGALVCPADCGPLHIEAFPASEQALTDMLARTPGRLDG